MNLSRARQIVIFFSFSIALQCELSLTVMKSPSAQEQTFHRPVKAIIFDIGGVFSKISISRYMSTMGLLNILRYSLVDRKIVPWALREPFQERYFEVLKQTDYELDPSVIRTRTMTGEEIPALLCGYQAGKISAQEAYELLDKTIKELKNKNFFISDTEELLIRRAIHATFTPEVHVEAQEIIPETVEILKELAALKDDTGERKYLLIALSNWDRESFDLFKQKNRALFDCFHFLYVSGEQGVIKPNREAWTAIFDAHRLRPEECVFVDDQIENIIAGKECGIVHLHHFVTKKPSALRAYLQTLGILDLKKLTTSDSYTRKPLMVALAITAMAISIAHYNL